MKKVTVEISSDPQYCEKCKFIAMSPTSSCYAAPYKSLYCVLAFAHESYLTLEYDDKGKLQKCRWCLDYQLEEI